MNLRVQHQPAYVLHRRAYKETSAILELFTRDHGRIAGVARGARGGRRAAWVEPFVEVDVSWTGRSALRTVTAIEPTCTRTLLGDRLFAGLYVNELLVRCVGADEPFEELFASYEHVIDALASDAVLEPTLRIFEKELLRCLGYEVVFDVDAHSGEPVEDDRFYTFVDGEGMCGAGSDADGAFLGGRLKSIQRDDFEDDAVRRDAKRLLRRVLKPHLGDRPLQTRQLFRH